ncbi:MULTISPECIES: hypothetical protein [Paenibacillus]|uniref:hypothetical protein n=1 Tax=Paenibacillus TaxID=44249 RepID=UPI00187BAF3B|nr:MULTISPECIES: hypothetical protein [Paenibacillus]MBE7681509.1 hypothetical protein [Paenibacillus sp. P13VS]MBY0216192.1 hypothetical protein [Paenibacillus illinoisensis]WJH31367.1 hypothetical protein N6H13_12905 [Paenibacillus sp. CC-CFT742]
MPTNRRLETEADFQEAMELQHKIRVFKNNHQIDSGGVIIRFDSQTIVVQSSVSELAYHSRTDCEFFEIRK